MTSPLDRAARSAYEQGEAERSTTFGVDWNDPSLENVRETFRRRARAVLTAIREPSEGMIVKGQQTVMEHWQRDDGPDEDSAEQAWQAMIDAALSEQ